MNRVDTARMDEVLPYFDGKAHIAEALGIARQKPYKWGNRVPRNHRKVLEEMIENDAIPPRKARKWHRREPVNTTPLLSKVLGE
jgi:hypothetical protein